MLANYYIGIGCIFNIMLLCQGYPKSNNADKKDNFSYQESENGESGSQNAMRKQPVHFPSGCKDGELYYPGDQGDDWVCDCRPGFLYYPNRSLCYEAYKQGPCLEGQILILPKHEVIPKCEHNPCNKLNNVRFENSCYELGTPGPCPFPTYPNLVDVDERTLEIICTQGLNFTQVESRFGTEDKSITTTTQRPEPEFYNKKECFRGGIRWISTLCPQQDSKLKQ